MTSGMPERLDNADVCAILVTYHPDAEFPARISRIATQAGALVIVDNGSDVAELGMIRRVASSPGASCIENGANLGIARALNLGIAGARAQGYRWALLLDQDTEAHAGMLRALIDARAAYPDPEQLAVIGAGFEASETLPAPDALAAAAGAPFAEVESAITSGSLVSLAAYDVIGPFRDEFFIDYVDTEYCVRARAKGFRVIVTRASLMSHAIGNPSAHRTLWAEKRTSNHSPDRRYYMARNDTVMLREHGRYALGLWALKSFGRRFRTARRILLYEDDKSGKLAALAAGWWDGVRGRMGPRSRPTGDGTI
jgi:rhamnosyltransferase